LFGHTSGYRKRPPGDSVLESLANRIAATDASQLLQNTEFVVPLSQSLHIVGIAVLFTCSTMINLRLLGLGSSARSVSAVIGTALPWMWRALILCVVTGALQTFIEPLRQFVTTIYWWKLLLIAILAALTFDLQRRVRVQGGSWDTESPPASMRRFAAFSVVGWITVIFLGRFIGYV
jgi:hypothetical protein